MESLPLFFTSLSLILIFIALLLAAWILIVGWNSARLTARAPLPLTPESLSDNYFSLANGVLGQPENIGEKAKLSVVVYVTDHGDSLHKMISQFTAQRTSFRYEMIVVCNASARETAAVAEQYSGIKGLRFSFIPPEAQNLSRRKLAFTVGIKAAEADVVLLTGSNVEPSSAGWFQLMAEPLLTNTELEMVIGTSRFDFSSMKGLSRRYRSFLWVTYKCSSLGASLNHEPYRGDWENIAMRRQFFFNAKGYAGTVHIETGDDDLFICESGVGSAIETVLAPAAMPEAVWGEWASRIWNVQRSAYTFTSRWLPRKPFLIMGATSLCNWLLLLALIASAMAPLLEPVFTWLPAIVAFFMWVCFEALQILFYRAAAGRLMQPRLMFLLPLFMLWRPIGNFIYRLTHRDAIHRNYTWQR